MLLGILYGCYADRVKDLVTLETGPIVCKKWPVTKHSLVLEEIGHSLGSRSLLLGGSRSEFAMHYWDSFLQCITGKYVKMVDFERPFRT